MLRSLYRRIARLLPPGVKRVLRAAMIVHAAPPRSGGDSPSNAAIASTEVRTQRDRARRELAETKRALTKLQRRTERPVEEWWEQRLVLAGRARGIGLSDFAYFPGGAQNPYLRLLYARLPEVGYDPRPLPRLDHLHRMPAGSVFHLHWTRIAQLGATDETDAKTKTAAFLDPIETFVKRGGTLVWSIHEPLPHDCAFPGVEAELRRRLGELAASIHILHPATIDEIGTTYPVPAEKVFVVEHPLYDGVYERVVPREAARRLLGLSDDEVMILCLGAIRPYKGFDRVVELADTLQERTGRPVRIMIAGPTMAAIDLDDLYRAVDRTTQASISAEPVPDDQLHVILGAADVMALPYRAVLNSGVLMLGLTFDKICVAPRNPVTQDTLSSGLVELFDAADDDSLADALTNAVERSTRPHRLDAGYRDRYRAGEIAGRFAGHIDAVVGDGR